jgi:hypothetical protein
LRQSSREVSGSESSSRGEWVVTTTAELRDELQRVEEVALACGVRSEQDCQGFQPGFDISE